MVHCLSNLCDRGELPLPKEDRQEAHTDTQGNVQQRSNNSAAQQGF